MKTIAKRVGLALLILLVLILLAVGGYVGYMQHQYYRIPDHTALTVGSTAQTPDKTIQGELAMGTPYTAVSYNVGFGAYGPEYSFFMDTGTMLDGTQLRGEYGKALSAESVQQHTQGALEVLQDLDADFVLLQEVDVDSTRSYHIDQRQLFLEGMPGYSWVYDCNFHSAYLLYPFNDPHGAVQAGLVTLGRHGFTEAEHRSYPVDGSFITKFTDLDRCFTVLRVPVEQGHELVLINSHMSAYDKGGMIRQQQLQMLSDVMTQEYQKGNYVIVGGDFNHALGQEVAEAFPSQQQFPGWVCILDQQDLPEHFSIAGAENRLQVATCRGAEIPYEPGVNFSTVVDGFWVSDNIEYTVQNIDTGYAYSDHNPVRMTFILLDPQA